MDKVKSYLLVYLSVICGAVYCQLTCPSTDPCQDGGYTDLLDGPKRSLNAKSFTGTTICDTRLRRGWYRFADDYGNHFKIPVRSESNCIDVGNCSTVAPISVTQPAPTVTGVTKKLKGCINFISCCQFSVELCARYCGARGTLYYLTSPPACSIAYCTDAPACPRDHHIQNDSCVGTFPSLLGVPKLSVDSETNPATNEKTMIFKCDVTFLPSQNAKATVKWFKDKVYVGKQADSEFENFNTKVTAKTTLLKLFNTDSLRGVKIGFNLICGVQTSFVNGSLFSPVWNSSLFYAGLSVHPLTARIKENDHVDSFNFTLKPTVPIICDSSSGLSSLPCYLNIGIGGATFTSQDDVITSKCGIVFNESNWDVPQRFRIAAVRDQVNGETPTNQLIRVEARHIISHSPKSRSPSEWFHFQQQIRITTLNEDASFCEGTYDPHFKTFDGHYYHYYGVGEFWLVRSTKRSFAIQSRMWTCRHSWTSASCHCGVAIREGNDVVSIDQCFWQIRDPNVRLRNIPPKVRKVSSGELSQGFGIFKSASGMEYKVQLPSGAAVKIVANYYGMSIWLRAAEDDVENTEGLCGNDNGLREDDVTGGDGVKHAAVYGQVVDKAFMDSWGVPANESYFRRKVVENLAINGDQIAPKFCACVNQNDDIVSDSDCDVSLLVQPKAFQGGHWTQVADNKIISKRAADASGIDDDDDDDDYVFTYNASSVPLVPRWPTPSNITENSAIAECTKTLTNSPVAKTCIQAGIMKEVSNVTISSCVEDIKLSDDLGFAQTFLSSLVQQCEEDLATDVAFWKSNATGSVRQASNASSPLSSSPDSDVDVFLAPSLPPMIASSMCPGDCSNHGDCIDSNCYCWKNFTGPDCSIEANKAPVLIMFSNNGMCDIQQKPCRTAFVVGEGFLSSGNLSCLVHKPKTNEKFLSTSEFRSIYEVTCDLPISRVRRDSTNGQPVEHYSVQVTSDGVKYSNPLTYSIYNAVCFQCFEAGNCTLKRDACVIDGSCFAENETNPPNWCQQCLPYENQLQFSRHSDNQKPVFSSPTVVHVLKGEKFQMNLSASDDRTRPDQIRFNLVNDHGQISGLSSDGTWTWKVPSDGIDGSVSFSFVAIDECNETSDELIIRPKMIKCDCSSNGQPFITDRTSNGQGQCHCTCNSGFSGSFCEIDQSCPSGNCSSANKGLSTTLVIVSAVVPSLVVLAGVIAVICLCKKKINSTSRVTSPANEIHANIYAGETLQSERLKKANNYDEVELKPSPAYNVLPGMDEKEVSLRTSPAYSSIADREKTNEEKPWKPAAHK